MMSINRIFILTGLLAVFLLSSCGKEILNRVTTFRYTTEASFVIPNTPTIIQPLFLLSNEVQSSSSQEFKNNNTSVNLVKNVALEKLSLSIVNPQNQTFRFLRSIKIFIVAEGLPEIEIASNTNIPTDAGQTIELSTTKANLDSYIKKDRYRLRNEVVLREPTTQNIDARANMTFQVTADLLK
jgi:hypothetical protein